MGAQVCTETGHVAETKDTVKLHVYDVSGNRAVEQANQLFRAVGTGAFHAAIEVFGKEYSYGFSEKGSGVFSCKPKECSMHHFRESINLGETDVTEQEFNTTLEKFKGEWLGPDYDLLQHNCCNFSKTLAEALHVKAVPDWVTNLAGAGATVNKGIREACVKGGEVVNKAQAQAQAQAIIAAAKAGKIDEQYQIGSKVKAKADELLIKAGEIEAKYELQKHAEKLATEVQGHANRLGAHLAGFLSPQATSPQSAQSASPAK